MLALVADMKTSTAASGIRLNYYNSSLNGYKFIAIVVNCRVQKVLIYIGPVNIIYVHVHIITLQSGLWPSFSVDSER